MDQATVERHVEVIRTLSYRWNEFAKDYQKLNNSPYAPEGVAGAPVIMDSVRALASEINRLNHARSMDVQSKRPSTRAKRLSIRKRPIFQSVYRA